MIPSELNDTLGQLDARLSVETTGHEGFWGVLHTPHRTYDVAARVAGETTHLFHDQDLLMTLSRSVWYLNHDAFGVSALKGLQALIQTRGEALILHSALGLWTLPFRDDFSVDGRGSNFMPHTEDGRLSLIGYAPGATAQGITLYPATLLHIAQKHGHVEPYPQAPGWQPGPPQRAGHYFIVLDGKNEPELTTMRAVSLTQLSYSHPDTMQAVRHSFIRSPD